MSTMKKRIRVESTGSSKCKCMCNANTNINNIQKENVIQLTRSKSTSSSSSSTSLSKSTSTSSSSSSVITVKENQRVPLIDLKKSSKNQQLKQIPTVSKLQPNYLMPSSSFQTPQIQISGLDDDVEEEESNNELQITVIDKDDLFTYRTLMMRNNDGGKIQVISYEDIKKAKRMKVEESLVPLARSHSHSHSHHSDLILRDNIPLLKKKTLKRSISTTPVCQGVVDLDPNTNKVDTYILYTVYIQAIIENLMRSEQKYVLPSRFITTFNNDVRDHRIAIVNWLLKLQQHLRSDDSVFHISVRLLDKMLSITRIPSEIFQLVALAIYWIATKYNDIIAPPKAPELLKLCNNGFTANELCKTEQKVLRYLKFDLAVGEPMIFARYYIYNLQIVDSNIISLCANYFLDCFMLDHECNTIKASAQAAAAVLLSLHFFNADILSKWQYFRAYPGFHSLERMKIIQDRILSMVQLMQKSKFLYKEPFHKYCTEKTASVSTKIQNLLSTKTE